MSDGPRLIGNRRGYVRAANGDWMIDRSAPRVDPAPLAERIADRMGSGGAVEASSPWDAADPFGSVLMGLLETGTPLVDRRDGRAKAAADVERARAQAAAAARAGEPRTPQPEFWNAPDPFAAGEIDQEYQQLLDEAEPADLNSPDFYSGLYEEGDGLW